MFKNSIKRLASSDAAKWARAEMFYGEGAGTRRKLIKADIDHKARLMPGYAEAFKTYYQKQDLGKHAMAAIKERKRIDRTKSVNRNVRGLITGNFRTMTTTVALAATLWSFAQQTGADKKIIAYFTNLRERIQSKYEAWRRPRYSFFKAQKVSEPFVYQMND